jgi:putative transposase
MQAISRCCWVRHAKVVGCSSGHRPGRGAGSSAEMVGAATARSSLKPRTMLEQLGVIAGMLGRQSPWVDTSLTTRPRTWWPSLLSRGALEDGLEHEPLERLNKELKRPIDVVGVRRPPRRATAACRCRSGRRTIDWQATDQRYLGETTVALLTSPPGSS